MKEIGKTILETRKVKGITQEELADLAKVNLRTIQRLENNKNIPRGKTLQLVCDVLEISPNDFTFEKTKFKLDIEKTFNVFFFVTINIVLVTIIGFLTIDSDANFNSRFGGFLLSFLIPVFIIQITKQLTNKERFIKFGLAYLAYLIVTIVILGIPKVFFSGLLPCLLISIFTLYYGSKIIKQTETNKPETI